VHAALLELVSAGTIAPVIGRVIAMDEVAAALDDHANRRTSGRTVVDVATR
jgi:NADPH2:quinone reductase